MYAEHILALDGGIRGWGGRNSADNYSIKHPSKTRLGINHRRHKLQYNLGDHAGERPVMTETIEITGNGEPPKPLSRGSPFACYLRLVLADIHCRMEICKITAVCMSDSEDRLVSLF